MMLTGVPLRLLGLTVSLLAVGCFRSGYDPKEVDGGPCREGVTQRCYSGPAGTDGVGRCLVGLQDCVDGQWTLCEGEILPVEEECNGHDDDCDSEVDEELPTTCYTGPDGTLGIGPCHEGSRSCLGGAWTECVGQNLPEAETCDGADNDCDGDPDEDFDVDGDDVTTCGGDCNDSDAEVYPGAAETCDGADNNCDGEIDEELVAECYTGPAGTEEGECHGGTETCVAGFWGECLGEVTPAMRCLGIECGDDGCGGECSCPLGMSCDLGSCVSDDLSRVLIPAGTFDMGTTDFSDARPVHEVTISSAFFMDRYEVSVARYQECIDARSCPFIGGIPECNLPNGRTEHPMNCVPWAVADMFCTWAGGRLPTEAEWEYAARGTDERRYPWGNEPPDCTRAWTWDCYADYSMGHTTPVGSLPDGASFFGVEDMAGNLWEWVRDWYAGDYYPTCAAAGCVDPTGPETGTERGSRGGGMFASDVRDPRVYQMLVLRSALRDGTPPGGSYVDIGFRCVYPAD